ALAEPPRPPVLASESLREDMEPTEPWRRTLRFGGAGMGLTGAVATLSLGGLSPVVILMALGLLATGALCATPVRYSARAMGVLVLGSGGLAVATAVRMARGAPAEAPILAVGTVVLAGGLLFRSAYRASHLARTVVAAGMLAVAVALLLADAVGEFSQVGPTWQSWVHVATAVGFGILLLLSMLAFMAPSTTGGAQVWGVALLVWYATHVASTLVARYFPPEASAPEVGFPDPVAGAAAAAVASAVLAAFGLAQALAVRAGCTVEQRCR
ncbi:MAG: hypothetical protein ACODAU_06050, partial [Myxococcota bacterium]